VRPAANFFLAVKVGENNFVREERSPLEGGGSIGLGAAVEFVLAVGQTNQFSLAKPADEPAAMTLQKQIF
jgi:hypothetical protein